MTSLSVKRSKPYSFQKDKTTQIFEQAIKNGLPLPACKRSEDIRKAKEGDLCPYHRVLGYTIEECWEQFSSHKVSSNVLLHIAQVIKAKGLLILFRTL
jgi:hypothetical protein